MAFRFRWSAASNASGRYTQHLRRMSEYYRVHDDVYGLTDDQKQVTDVRTVLGWKSIRRWLRIRAVNFYGLC